MDKPTPKRIFELMIENEEKKIADSQASIINLNKRIADKEHCCFEKPITCEQAKCAKSDIKELQAKNHRIRNQWHIDLNNKVALRAEIDRLMNLMSLADKDLYSATFEKMPALVERCIWDARRRLGGGK